MHSDEENRTTRDDVMRALDMAVRFESFESFESAGNLPLRVTTAASAGA